MAKFFEAGGEFSNYWFSTGTPTFLLELMRKKRFNIEDVLKTPVSGFSFDAYEVNNIGSPDTVAADRIPDNRQHSKAL